MSRVKLAAMHCIAVLVYDPNYLADQLLRRRALPPLTDSFTDGKKRSMYRGAKSLLFFIFVLSHFAMTKSSSHQILHAEKIVVVHPYLPHIKARLISDGGEVVQCVLV